MALFNKPTISAVFTLLMIACLSGCNFSKPDYDTPPPPKLSARDQKIMEVMKTLPSSPSGYEWIFYKGVALLKPSAWFEYRNKKAYTITPVRANQSGHYHTGVTIQTITDIQKNNGISAEAATIKIIKTLETNKTNKRLLIKNTPQDGLIIIQYRYLNRANPKHPVVFHMYLIIDNKQSSIRIVKLKTPAASWKQNWMNRGVYMFKQIVPVAFF